MIKKYVNTINFRGQILLQSFGGIISQSINLVREQNASYGFILSVGLFIMHNCFVSIMYKSVITSKLMAPKQLRVIESLDDLKNHPEIGVMVLENLFVHNYLKSINFAKTMPNELILIPRDKRQEYSLKMATNLHQGTIFSSHC